MANDPKPEPKKPTIEYSIPFRYVSDDFLFLNRGATNNGNPQYEIYDRIDKRRCRPRDLLVIGAALVSNETLDKIVAKYDSMTNDRGIRVDELRGLYHLAMDRSYRGENQAVIYFVQSKKGAAEKKLGILWGKSVRDRSDASSETSGESKKYQSSASPTDIKIAPPVVGVTATIQEGASPDFTPVESEPKKQIPVSKKKGKTGNPHKDILTAEEQATQDFLDKLK